MTAFSGSALYLQWDYSGGSVVLNTDFRNFSWNPSLALIDSTAGADTFREFIPGIGEPGAITVEMVQQADGTALRTALAKGNQGTLTYGPEGTATGKMRFIIPAISKGPQYDQPYDDVVTFAVEFQQSAAHTENTF